MANPFEPIVDGAPSSRRMTLRVSSRKVVFRNAVSVLIGRYAFGTTVYTMNLLAEPGAWRVVKYWRKTLFDYQFTSVMMTAAYLIPTIVLVAVVFASIFKNASFDWKMILMYGFVCWVTTSVVQQVVRRLLFDVHESSGQVVLSSAFLLTCFSVGTILSILSCRTSLASG